LQEKSKLETRGAGEVQARCFATEKRRFAGMTMRAFVLSSEQRRALAFAAHALKTVAVGDGKMSGVWFSRNGCTSIQHPAQ
jgi:hypothetical protein